MAENQFPILEGVLNFHSETGTEGGYWAFQDERFITSPSAEWPYGQWSYEGLHILKTGDYLKIYNPEDSSSVVWEGLIDLKPHALFSEDGSGLWIHADQTGEDREHWAKMFFDEFPAELIKS